MKIRTRLALQFTLIVGSILILFSGTIYYSASQYRYSEFYERLEDRSLNTARLLIEVQEVDSSLLEIITKQNTALPFEKISIFSDEQKLLYTSNSEPTRISGEDVLFKSIREDGRVEKQIGQFEALGLHYIFDDTEYLIVASAIDKYGLSKLNNLKWILILGLVICLIITVLAAFFFSNQALKPMSNVVEQVDQISVSNLNSRVDEGNKKDEIAQLGMTFNKMLERIESSFEMQKNFVSNASHELRTPLTAIAGQLEVGLMKERSTDEYRQVMKSVKEDIAELTDLVNGLLDLARLNAVQSEFKFTDLRIDELLWEARADLIKANAHYYINIHFAFDISDSNLFELKGNEQLLKSAFSNLMDNACKFSSDHQVNVRLASFPDRHEIEFEDLGVGINPNDLSRIFQPFYRSKSKEKTQGYGLGLPLTKKIVELHGGEIVVKSELTKGTTFFLSIPKR